MSNVPAWRIFRSGHLQWLLFGSALFVVLGSYLLYAVANRQRVSDWPIDPDYHWTRELDLTHGIATSENEFTVGGVAYINGKLYAGCAYKKNHAAWVHGIVDSYGRFWPEVRLEASREFPPRWKKIGNSPHISGKTETKQMAPGQAILAYVDLDPYRTLFGKYRIARLVTETGASATVELKDILPPCENWPAGMDCLPAGPSPELVPISDSESTEEGGE